MKVLVCVLGFLITTGRCAVSSKREAISWAFLDQPNEFDSIGPVTPTFLTSYNAEKLPKELDDVYVRLPWNGTNDVDDNFQHSSTFPKWKPTEPIVNFKGTMSSGPHGIPPELGHLLNDMHENDIDVKPGFQRWLEETEQRKHKYRDGTYEHKRSHGTHAQGHHHWTCESEFGWRNLGRNHYPQFVRTANCTSTSCFNGLFQCVPKEYTIKVLKKLESDEVIDVSLAAQLPESLRNSVKFINVTINICCECALV